MTAYLQTFAWGVEWVERYAGRPMLDMGSKLYSERGIRPGDMMYLAYIDEDRLLNLISRLEVGKLRREGKEYRLLPRKGTSTTMALGRVVPKKVAKKLEFLVRNGFDPRGEPIYLRNTTQLTYNEGKSGELKSQTARTIRRLTANSAQLLDEVLHEGD